MRWQDQTLGDSVRLQALQTYNWQGFLFSNPDSSYNLSQIQYDFARAHDQPYFERWALLTQGVTFKMRGNSPAALNYYLRSLKLFNESGDSVGIAGVLNNIAMLYLDQKDFAKAKEYNLQSLQIRIHNGDPKGQSASYSNLGDIAMEEGDLDLALEYYQRSGAIKDSIGFIQSMPEAYRQVGTVYQQQGKFDDALAEFEKALNILASMEEERMHSEVLISIGATYFEKNDLQRSIRYCNRALAIAKKVKNVDSQIKACDCLYKSYRKAGNMQAALVHFEEGTQLRDSLHSSITLQKLQSMEFQNRLFTDSLKQFEKDKEIELAHLEEVRKQNQSRNALLAFGGFILIISGGLYSRLRFVRRSKKRLHEEMDRSESLLLNILPEEIAEELKEKGRADARDFETVSILFSDFKEFTETSIKLSAAELVSEINICFEQFDLIMERYNIEKIKTIGDAYMAAGGLPIPKDDSAKNTVLAALDMQEFIRQRKAEQIKRNDPFFEMRVGIHTGPVVAGIVGVKKFQYDIWGDTVNTASRMESNGEAGKVNISRTTYEKIQDEKDLEFEYRGMVDVKGKGPIEMWFVTKRQTIKMDF